MSVLDTAASSALPLPSVAARPASGVALRSRALLAAVPIVVGTVAGSTVPVVSAALHRTLVAVDVVRFSRIRLSAPDPGHCLEEAIWVEE